MTVLVGYNGTPESRAAVEYGARTAAAHGWPLHLVRYIGHEAGESPTQVRREVDRTNTAATELEALAERFNASGTPTTVGLLHGLTSGAAQALLDEAASVGAELIVLGLDPRSKVSKLVLGSVAQDVLLHAACPVMTVRAD